MEKIRAYSVYYKSTEGYPDHCHDVVFARNTREAKNLAWKKGECTHYWDSEWTDLRVRRLKDLDWWASFVSFPCVGSEVFERDPCFLREAYDFHGELPECECCGMSDTSEVHPDPEARKLLHERWKVCPSCGFCRECGHADDCPKASDGVG